jgi:hypothetical protein
MVPETLLPDFAEVCGIHAGDGWMSSYTNEIGYGTNLKEEQYFQDVLRLYKHIFGFVHCRILRRLAVELRFQSKEGQALLQSVGFVRGKKLGALRVLHLSSKRRNSCAGFCAALWIPTDMRIGERVLRSII